MKNSLADLNNHLFETLERLNDDDLTEDEIKKEVTRSSAIISISQQIVETGRLQLDVLKLQNGYNYNQPTQMPELLKIEKKTT